MRTTLAVAACGALLSAACSAEERSSSFRPIAPTAGSSSSGPSGAGGSMNPGPPVSGTGGNGLTIPDASGQGGHPNLADGEACATTSSQGKAAPLDIFIMLDQSLSMQEDDKWTNVTEALKTFVQSSKAAGMGVGLGYFAVAVPGGPCPGCRDCGCVQRMCGCLSCSCTNNDCSCGPGSSCSAMDYANPDVEIAPLPGNGMALVASLGRHMPSTDTPTRPALEGAIAHAKAWATSHPTDKVIVVLATDGEPSSIGCMPNAIPDVERVAQAGFTGSPAIPTYVIGVGSSLMNLNQIAIAGGTDQAYIVDAAAGTTQQFIDALDSIRTRAGLACEYLIPQPTKGGMLDYSKVNVRYTPGTGGPAQTIYYVRDRNGCDPATGGWYYDSPPPGTPTKIVMCDATCNQIKNDTAGQMEILLGCATITPPPR